MLVRPLALVTTIKDSKGNLTTPMSAVLPILNRIYSKKGAVMPKSTDAGLVKLLRDDGWHLENDRKVGLGNVRRQVVRIGLKLGTGHMHFCESDRLIVWASRYPNELADVASKISRFDFLVIGRTNRAFRTHPRTQRDTEAVTNAVCSLLLRKSLDVTCASRGLSRSAASYLCARSTAEGYETDVEWPFLMFNQERFRTGYAAVEGLEYEDWLKEPDQIRRLGYDGWLRAKESNPREWTTRTRWAARLVQTALQLHSKYLA